MSHTFTIFQSPIGSLQLIASDTHLTHLLFERHHKEHLDGNPLIRDDSHPILSQTHAQLQDYFAGRLTRFTVPLSFEGTPFQQQVWAALQAIPHGETRSYADLAATVGNPKAVRAVGTANGRNPIAIIIPCHRVIGADSHLAGYGGGLPVKQRLLELEGLRVDNDGWVSLAKQDVIAA